MCLCISRHGYDSKIDSFRRYSEIHEIISKVKWCNICVTYNIIVVVLNNTNQSSQLLITIYLL